MAADHVQVLFVFEAKVKVAHLVCCLLARGRGMTNHQPPLGSRPAATLACLPIGLYLIEVETQKSLRPNMF